MITRIVEDISGLNLLEVADLNSLLKSKLNISDAPVMMAGAAAPAPAAAAPAEEEEEAAPQVIQTSFTVKLNKFVESAPAVVKADIAKDEAEKIQAALQAVGGECVVVSIHFHCLGSSFFFALIVSYHIVHNTHEKKTKT